MSKYIGHFELAGDFDPGEITRLLAIEPSWVHRKGVDWLGGAKEPRKNSLWVLHCMADAAGDVDDQIVSLLSNLWPKRDLVAELCSRHQGTFHVYAYMDSNYMGFWLSREQLQNLVALRVEVECHYIYAKEGFCDDPASWGEDRDIVSTIGHPELIEGHQIRLAQLSREKDG
jgi:hypothetical protein